MNYSGPKAIRVEKVRFNKGGTSCGLKAAADIEPSVVILASCSSMSSDLVLDRPGVSIINSNANQKGKLGPRLILGPFRFANHDCCPNCQVRSILSSQLPFSSLFKRSCPSQTPTHTLYAPFVRSQLVSLLLSNMIRTARTSVDDVVNVPPATPMRLLSPKNGPSTLWSSCQTQIGQRRREGVNEPNE